MAYADGHSVASPRQQMNAGTAATDVQCNMGLQLMIKFNGDAACVKPSTAPKLVAADWGTIEGDVVTELPSNEEAMELDEEMTIEEETENNPVEEESEEDGQSHKIKLRESMHMESG